jgi:fimbrial isopeptide formation D2 family protein/uncharacterized repeat protein (TIGR01451 family)
LLGNKKSVDCHCLFAKFLIAGSTFSCLTVNVLKKTLLLVSLNRRASLTMPSAQSNKLCSDRFEAKAGDSKFSFMLLLFILLLAGASTANAGLFCSDAPFGGPDNDGDGKADYGIIDGNLIGVPAASGGYGGTVADPFPTQITIDTTCTFQNFPASSPLTATLNFQTNDPSVYLITFNNVVFTGNMACSNVDHRIWFVNGSDYGSNNSCQDLFIPVEAINKQNPVGKTTVGIGEQFTYTLTIPVLFDPVTQTYINNAGSANDLHSLTITDDLNATGANLTLVGTPTVVWDDGSATPVAHTFNEVGGLLTFVIDPGIIIPAGDQILIDITVVADNTNAVGTPIINTAKWSFGRLIEIDGVPTFFDPLPGENGVTQPMTIGGPDLVVDKRSLDTTLSPLATGTFTLDVQNIGSSDAWEATIVDQLPDLGLNVAGMCDFDPTTGPITAGIYDATGTILVNALTAGVDYAVNYVGDPTCELTFVMTSANAVIGPTERLIISYQSKLDIDTTVNNAVLTNVAGATQWFSGDGSFPRATFNNVLDEATARDNIDFQDSFDVTVGLAGYYFQKIVSNNNTGANPATTAAAGDVLHYRLRVFNVNQTVNNIEITDQLEASSFVLNTFAITNQSDLDALGAVVDYNDVTGLLTINGGAGSLNVAQGTELLVEFDIQTLSTLGNADVVSNQALLTSTSGNDIESDDPFINGVDDPQDLIDAADPTEVTILTPGALDKVNNQATATIGETFTYTITVPAAPVAVPLYDVRILDDLTASAADMTFVSASVLSGGAWTLTNTGSGTSLVIEDTSTGIDIPANGQVEIEVTVLLQNTATNQNTLPSFTNSASFTYNRTNGVLATQTDGGGDTSGSMTVLEPNISAITKLANNTSPTAGEIVRYTVTLTASSGAGFSDVFDVVLTDSLDLGLVYEGTPTVTGGGVLGAGNIIGEPEIIGDGIVTPQTLIWSLGSTDSSDIDIEAGTVVTVEYDVRVLDSVLANQVLNNSVVALWSSIDGAGAFERDGSDGIGGLNNYVTAPAIETLTTPALNATIVKARSSDTYNAGDDNVRIGDTVDYTLTISMDEGTLGNLQLVDTLPQGLDFDSIVSINGNTGPFTAVAPFSHAEIILANVVEVGDPAIGPSTVTWNLGDVTNLPVNDASDDFVIVYRARILNDALNLSNLNFPLNNVIEMSYDTATSTITGTANDTITVLQPQLRVTKSAAPQFLDTVLVADELVTYTVDIENTGTSDAYDVVLQDVIPIGLRDGTQTVTVVSSDLVSVAGYPPLPPVYNAATGIATWDFDIPGSPDAYTIPAGDILRVVYRAQADNPIGPGLTMTNAATATLYYSFDNEDVPVNSIVTDRQTYGPSNTATTTLTTSPGAPTKANPLDPTATIGQEFTYTITIPEAAQPTPLFDVIVSDNLTAIGADVTLVSLSNLSGGTWVPTNTSGTNDLVIADVTNGIDIPANQQAVIGVTVRVNNVGANVAGNTFSNTAAYTYNAIDGDNGSQLTGGSSVTPDMTVVEPDLTMTKVVSNATLGKAPADPITGGDILQYVVTINNTGTATAYDINVVDTLPSELTYYAAFTPTATIDGGAVAGFVTTPAGVPAGPLNWGQGNGDASLDVPAGSELVITYQAQIQVTTAATFNNSVLAEYSSLDGTNTFERDGAGCLVIPAPAPDDYCVGPVQVISSIVDNSSISKAITNDSWTTDGSTAADATVRVGDIVNYQLTLNLGEGTTSAVTVTDTLPAGLVYQNLVSITPASGAGSFSYTVGAQPAPGAAGALVWNLGDVVNAPSNDNTPLDALIIEYQARVIENNASTVVQQDSQVLQNTATLAYTNSASNSNPVQLTTSADLTVRQPVMTAITKLGALTGDPLLANTNISPLNVNVATDTVDFQLESCNTAAPAAPAYNIDIIDGLPTQLDDASITGLTVSINGVVGTAGVDYNYTPPAGRGGAMQFELLTAVQPGQCVTINYTMGFYTDFGPDETWNNSAGLNEYWSLPASSGQQYPGSGPAEFFMTNQVIVTPLNKVVVSPASGEITIGEEAVYTIVVPAAPVNGQLNNVVVTDTLVPELGYIEATAVDNGGLPVVLVDTTTGQNVALSITQIPAGDQVTITLRTLVANNSDANAGDSFTNTAQYDYTGKPAAIPTGSTSGAILIVEPEVTILKDVAPNTPPSAGDVLTYTLTFTASDGANNSDAFDLRIEDTLSLGLEYVPGTATVDGTSITDPVIVAGDGINTPYELRWSIEDSNADIDIVVQMR